MLQSVPMTCRITLPTGRQKTADRSDMSSSSVFGLLSSFPSSHPHPQYCGFEYQRPVDQSLDVGAKPAMTKPTLLAQQIEPLAWGHGHAEANVIDGAEADKPFPFLDFGVVE